MDTSPQITDFTRNELERYSRQILLFGRAGQLRLKKARVAVLGAGGLGHPALAYLATSGVGTIDLYEFDVVERHNISRQFLFSEADVGRPKAEVAVEQLKRINPLVQVNTPGRFEPAAFDAAQNDILLEGSDSLSLKFAVSDLAIKQKTPAIIGALAPTQGHVFPVFSLPHLPHLPCYRCVFKQEPPGELPTCASGGVISPIAGVLGTMMASLTVQYIAQKALPTHLLLLEKTRWRELKLKRNPECNFCSKIKEN